MSKYLEMNSIFNGKYQINSVLGENPLAITYGGMDTSTNSKIVIREFFPSGMCSRTQDSAQVLANGDFEKEKAQFLNNAQVLKKNAALTGIATLYDVFEENGTAYSVVEYVEGISLEKYLSGNGKQFPIKRIKELVIPVLTSLSVLHKAGITHQDISPDNLIFTNQGTLKLIGFGSLQGQISDASTGYAPVELYRRQQEIKPTADIYALCASIYRCITGVQPQDAYGRLNSDQIKKPSELGIAIAPDEESILMMGMNVYEEKRFQTIAAFQNAFYRNAANTIKSEPVTNNRPIADNKSVADDRIDQSRTICIQPLEEKTEVIQPPAGAQPPAIPDEIVAPADAENANKNKKKEKKKQEKQEKEKQGGNIGMIAAITGGVVLIAVLGVVAFIMGKDLLSDPSKNVAKSQKETDVIEETSSEQSSHEEDDQVGAAYEAMLESGDYTGVIDQILALDTSSMKAEEKDAISGILSRAVEGQYASFESQVSNCQSAGDYDGALAAVNEESALYDRYEANAMSAQYVDRQRIEDKRTGVKNAHVNYLLGERLNSVVTQGDENALEEILSKIQEYVNEGLMGQEEFEKKKADAYARFCIEKVTVMNASGTDAASIQNYINDNLGKTGNSCQMLEFWDYFNSVRGLNAMDDTIRHASANGHFLENSDTVNLTIDDIKHLTRYEMRLAIYEIFARHGKIFSDQAVNGYFGRYTWYQPNESFDESTLNEVEEYNLNLLVEYQKAMGYR